MSALASAPAGLSVLTIHGSAGDVRFAPALLLAPMEGITERCFRDLVIALGGVGGACSEFIRVSSHAIPERTVRRHLGPAQAVPVGVQLMAADATHIADSVRAAESAGAAFIDLNFGCPAPVVFGKCAGSALLAMPDRLAAIIAAAVDATGLPVTAKMRAGITDPDAIEAIVAAAVGAGAAALTVHARLRTQSYASPATWAWLTRAKAALAASARPVPLIGNGGVDTVADIVRVRAETGCDAVMIGRAALADPWIFAQAAGAAPPTSAHAADFALRYAAALTAEYGERTALARLKQLVRYYRAGELFAGQEDVRQGLLRSTGIAAILAWFARV